MLMRPAFLAFLLLSATAHAADMPLNIKQQVLWDRLRLSIAQVEQQLDGVLGIAILDLNSGQQLLVRPDEVFPQASSIKIAVLAELYHQAQQSEHGVSGKATLKDRYVVRAADIVPDSAILGGLTPGVSSLTNRDLATIMVAVSDNSATNVLIDRVGMDNVLHLTESLGLAHTQLRRKMMDLQAAAQGRENISTPREMMELLEQLYRGKVIAQPLLDDFFTVLATSKDSWIPRALPPDLKIANKPGELEGVTQRLRHRVPYEPPVRDLCHDHVSCKRTCRRGGHHSDLAIGVRCLRPPESCLRLGQGDFTGQWRRAVACPPRLEAFPPSSGESGSLLLVGEASP